MCLAMAGVARGQATASHLAFDAATVRPAAPLDMAKMAAAFQAGQMPKIGPHVDAGRAEYNYMALRELIAMAYGLKPYQVSGPTWMTTTRFDILATLPEGAAKSDAPAMLQALLKDRFKLAAHKSTEERPVLALVVGKSGVKMKPATVKPVAIDENAPLKKGEMAMDTPDGPVRMTISPDGSSVVDMGEKGKITRTMDMSTQTMHMESDSMTMDVLVEMLTSLLQMGGATDRQVVDQTGLTGHYQATLDVSLSDLMNIIKSLGMNVSGAAAMPDASDPSGTTLFSSVETLGLKLEPRKAPVEQLVIDNVEKTPTAN